MIERGINLRVTVDSSVDTPDKLNARLNQIFAYLHNLNANALALEFPVYVDGPTGNEVTTGPETPSLEMLEQIIRFANNRNIMVKLRPKFDTTNLEDRQPSELQPTNRERWIATYILALKPFADLARRTAVQEFQVGSELNSLERDPAWEAVLYELGKVFRRALTYTESWALLEAGTARPPTSVYGIAAYPPFSLSDQAPLIELTAAWNAWLHRVGTNYNLERMVLDEVGIPGAAGSYRAPRTPGDAPGLVPDQTVQASWFIAVCTAAQRHGMRGVYFSSINLASDPYESLAPGEQLDKFTGRLGDAAIKTCFAA